MSEDKASNPETAVSPKLHSLLEFFATTAIASTKPFIAKEKFRENTSPNAKPRISRIGGNFKYWFLDKVEQPIGRTTICSCRLVRASLDKPIIVELGGEAQAETALSEVFALISRQPNGESGVLLANGWANIFYVRDVCGMLRAVYVFWFSGWNVCARALDDNCWRGDDQEFSRSRSG